MVVFIDACDFFLLFSVWFWSYSLKDDIEFTIVRETIRRKLEASFTIVSMNCFIKVYTLPNTFINPRFWSSKFQKNKIQPWKCFGRQSAKKLQSIQRKWSENY